MLENKIAKKINENFKKTKNIFIFVIGLISILQMWRVMHILFNEINLTHVEHSHSLWKVWERVH